MNTLYSADAMETLDLPPAAFFNRHPNSPPMTPAGARSQIRSAPTTRHTSPISKRMGMSHLAQTPPLEYIEPTGHGHQFRFTRPQSLNLSSRPSSISGRVQPTTPQDSESEFASDEDSEVEEIRPMRRTEKAYFVLEELESDPGYDSDIEIVRPDHFEDAKSEIGSKGKNEVYERLKELDLDQDSSDEEEQERRYRQKKKRWSAGVFKRSHSQSVEGDSSYSDNDPADDNNIQARRLRRRVRGAFDRRGSLIFQDPGYSNTNNILEVDEPIEGMVPHTRGPPSIPSDDAFTLDEMPFWKHGEIMDFSVFESDF
ncbi:hypothetical protein HBI56_032260 [Parastagonospora nodorum]|uniref:Uncharacterized protein n=2 Tax=Phaeosphaeria nodorum (strain SN15 / ATCC MYA-4574 / FGSC 10173) TaxID=321614 RepID=A0A7U2F2D7_PHANO|nr:hypothetical protein HBH56_019990 [Parastagonospora nodorum]QRC95390.1 hypothetical protein JI435_030840 [Parastagonospora nodorum SN15]KAH3937533.1 hypothetical protein HBH54_014520 [Parastagonospora nodorum]KAH3953532.1 hypothetical protein HBH53_026680 [Parastagonospora nodorum]KAH3967471.1 hypothetical protein HBH51_138190 [Parastagonospora nodorum]